jgi:flagellar biosynthesis chaperone FliJ
MNSSQGITPTIELATTNGNNGFAYPYPVYPMYGNGGFGGNNGFLGGDGIWAILLFALLFGNGGWGNGGFFGGNSFDNGYAWLSNGQKDIMTNTNNGFDTLHLSNQLEGTRDGINSLSNQLCNCCADINGNISNGFYTAEVAACNRQMANMNQNFNNQLSTLQSFNGLERQLCDCCCENRLGIANLNSTILAENCADRAALADGLKDILINQTANTQKILDQLCSDKIDEKNDKIRDLERQLSMKDLQASQIAQNSFIAQGFANEVDALYNRLSSCPVPSTPVYGRTPIFTCPNNNGCGCGNFTTSQFI